MAASALELGRRAEALAERLLIAKGYRLLERSFRTRRGEIDLVMEDGSCLVLVEVRSRAATLFGGPEQSVGPVKRARLARAALAYMQSRRVRDRPARFDVVAVSDGEIRHLKDAFRPEPGSSW